MSTGAPALAFRSRGRRSRARAGDPEAFAALYAKHEQELFRYCRSILGNEHDARDALQNAMLKAFSALQTEGRDLALRPWLFKIAHNEAISLVRRRPATAELDETLGGPEDSVDRTVQTRERLSLLRADLQDLPERQRGALVMRELSGLSHEQIGEALGTSARAVKQTLYEARSSLADCEEGRAMHCEAVQRALSDGDGRVSRSRRMRAHLRTCTTCERFRIALVQRPAELAALSPAMPLLGVSGIAAALKGTTVVGGAVGGTAATVATGAGGGFGASILAAGAAKVAVVAATVTVAGGAAVVAGTSIAD
ncbi:MAG: sigma-70 family RNA polymerase sigma factor, partial [Actinobacteria bacterium]|nr:sigma-70 family RNA polymerase sigma factor [Actinomycetota bacterium]